MSQSQFDYTSSVRANLSLLYVVFAYKTVEGFDEPVVKDVGTCKEEGVQTMLPLEALTIRRM